MKMRILILAFTIWSCQALREDCPRPPLKNGFFVPHMETYNHGEKTSYGCNTGLKPALQTWWGEITCSHGNWSHTPECINNTWCIVPEVAHAQPAGEVGSYFAPGDHDFTCDHGYELAQQKSKALCKDGEWKLLPVCKRARGFCAPPPRVTNGMIKDPYKDLFESEDMLEYVCAEGYELVGSPFSTCRNGEWSPQPRCDVITCRQPEVRYGRPDERGELKRSYKNGETVKFVCNGGYKFEGPDYARCENGNWRLPVCKDPTSCSAPDVPNAQPTQQSQSVYRTGSSVTFECNDGYEFESRDRHYAQCERGTWRLPVCQPQCRSPHVPNARPRDRLREFYSSGSHVSFECKNSFEFLRRDHYYATCEKGTWRLPVCKPRGATVCVDLRVPNAQPLSELKSYYTYGQTVQFVCDQGYEFYGTPFAICERGQWILPECKRSGGSGGSLIPDGGAELLDVSVCGSQPLIDDGDVTELPGEKELKVQCKMFYKLVGPDRIRCVEGKWTELPVCKPPCLLDKTRIHSGNPYEYLQEGEEKEYICPEWTSRWRWMKRYIQCSNGRAQYTECY